MSAASRRRRYLVRLAVAVLQLLFLNHVAVLVVLSVSASASASTTTSVLVKSSSSSSSSSTTNHNAPPSANTPIKVFILAGQSNMVGYGSIEHLESLIHSNLSSPSSFCPYYSNNNKNIMMMNEYRAHLWNETLGGYNVKDNVYIKFRQSHGKLTVGRGASKLDSIGPELMFGWTIVEEADDDAFRDSTTILLIKTAWDGKSLAVDFRPPSSGWGNYSNKKPEQYGVFYRKMIHEIQETLAHLPDYVPVPTTSTTSSNSGYEYELVAFVWLQGWSDFVSMPMVQEYSLNLVNLIRDVRNDLQAPQLPFVIGELGMHGTDLDVFSNNDMDESIRHRIVAMRSRQHAITLRDEFLNNTLLVRTSPFVVANGTKYDGVHHYYGRADTYFHIGQALGRGTLQLLKIPTTTSKTTAFNIYYDKMSKRWCEQQGSFSWRRTRTTNSFYLSLILFLFLSGLCLILIVSKRLFSRAVAPKLAQE